MRKPPFIAASMVALGLSCSVGGAELHIDAAAPFKPVDHAASGSLYGLAAEGWPDDRWIAAVAPKNFTQMAPGGTHRPNGEPAPIGDALDVAPIAERHGATVTIRLPDLFPSFPYVWQGEEFWFSSVAAIVSATVESKAPNIYAYEIWNEADWNWQPGWGDFDDVWARTHQTIRRLDPSRPVMGPSISRWNESWMRRFLENAIESRTVPDIVSWHELDPRFVGDLTEHVAGYRALEQELGIGPLPISINEYGAPRDAAVPGALTRFVARLERSGIDTANLAFWHKPGRLGDLIAPVAGGRGPAIYAEPTGAYWVYKWYGDMAGQMVNVLPESPTGDVLDGFASLDPTSGILRAVVGGEDGDHTISLSGLSAVGAQVEVQVYATRWTGTDGDLPSPRPLFSRASAAPGGQLNVEIPGAGARDAFLILVAAPGAAPTFPGADQRFRVRLEAEDADLVGARIIRFRMSKSNFFAPTVSNDAYVGLLDRDDVRLMFTVDVPASGNYRLTFGYSNGLDDTAEYLVSVNGDDAVPLSFTPTQFRELIDTSAMDAVLPAGASTITLLAGPRSPKDALAGSMIEVDYLDVETNASQ